MKSVLAENGGTIFNGTASAGVVGAQFLGMGIPDWAALLTGVYFAVSTAFLVMKIIEWRKGKTDGSEG